MAASSTGRIDVVVGVTPELGEKIENYRLNMEAEKGTRVTRVDAIRALFNLAFEKLAEKPTSYTSVPRYSPAETPIPVSQ